VRWSWRPNNNRSTQHPMVADFGNERRVMRRVTLTGIQCRGIDGRCGRAIRIEALPAAAE
jgi:taurine dioxygenase